jgi:hypothetical protein
LAGAYELSQPQRQASPFSLTVFVPAFAQLGYDFGVLSSTEAKQLMHSNQGPDQQNIPSGWKLFSSQPQTAVLNHQGIRLGLILFPEAKALSADSSRKNAVFDHLGQTILALDDFCDLTIGLSPWGFNIEQDFLHSDAYAPALLLGSGSGPAILGKLGNNDRTLWLRPFSRGRAVQVVSLPNPEERSWKDQWKIEDNVHIEFLVLDDTIATNKEMEDLLKKQTQ